MELDARAFAEKLHSVLGRSVDESIETLSTFLQNFKSMDAWLQAEGSVAFGDPALSRSLVELMQAELSMPALIIALKSLAVLLRSREWTQTYLQSQLLTP